MYAGFRSSFLSKHAGRAKEVISKIYTLLFGLLSTTASTLISHVLAFPFPFPPSLTTPLNPSTSSNMAAPPAKKARHPKALPRSWDASLQFGPIPLISAIIQKSPCKAAVYAEVVCRRRATGPGHWPNASMPFVPPLHTRVEGYVYPEMFLRFPRSARRSK